MYILRNIKIIFCLLIGSLFLVTGCGLNKTSFIEIISITPETLNPLYVEDTVEVKVEVKYKVMKVPATITLNIQRGYDSVIASKEEMVFKKRGKIFIKQTFKVPESGVLGVYVFLNMEGQASTDIVAVRNYKVIKK